MKRWLLFALASFVLGCGVDAAADRSSTEDKAPAGGDKNPVVVMETSLGTVKIELLPKEAPATVKNFLGYVDDRFYDGTIFHRVVPGFVVQGGGMEVGGKEKKTKAPIKNEAGNNLSNKKYTVAMARTRNPDSATSQFYINLKDNGSLDKANDPFGAGYCVFGKVIDGKDVVDKIGAVETGAGDVPTKDVVIKSIRRAE